MMKVTLRLMSLLFGLLFMNLNAWAQPANDDCTGAFEVMYADDEGSAVQVDCDTRGASASTEPTNVCSGSWYTDDVWVKFTSPSVLPDDGIRIRVYFNNAVTPTDVPAIGMAIYESCDAGETPFRCFSSDQPEDNRLEIPSACLQPDHEYVVRIWSTGNTPATEGTFRVAVFANTSGEPFLWYETFAGGFAANGWTTEGTCAVPDSNVNAGWKDLPEGLLDKGAYIFAGAAINSPTLCDGAVGVDSDYDDNAGIEGNFGAGPCPAPAQHILISPELPSNEWAVAGLSLTWNQAIRQFQSEYFVSFRTQDGADPWSDWTDIQINTEFPTNGGFSNSNVQRIFLPGAAGHDMIQIRFVYNANYYMWGIDDVKLVETECNNLRAQENFFAIAPWASIPSNQVYPFCALNDIFNAGACEQTNVVLNHRVYDLSSMDDIYNENLDYGTVAANFLDENRVFPTLIDVPPVMANYRATYHVTSDAMDFDTTDNVITYDFNVGGSYFAHEDTVTRSVAVATGVYDQGAPLSYAYGNVFFPQVDAKVQSMMWGVNNTADMAGYTVNLYLLQWTDNNGDRIAQPAERRFIGYSDYTFTGTEGANAIFNNTLDNFENPGEDVVMRGGFMYFAMVEYVATTADDPQFFLLSSEDHNYNAQVLGMDTAFNKGISDYRVFMTVLGHSPDGIIANIDYEVTDVDGAGPRIHFSDDIVPFIRLLVGSVNTKDQLPSANLITAYPNPATDLVQVKLEFAKTYSDVHLRLVDNTGRIVYQKKMNQAITQHIETIHVNDLAAGNYMLQVETEDGQRSTPVVVVR